MKKKDRHLFNPLLKGISLKVEAPKTPSETPEQSRSLTGDAQDDKAHFLEAMAGVTPISSDKGMVVRRKDIHVRPSHPAPDDEMEAMTHLKNLIKGSVEMDITFSDEYIEGAVSGVGRKIMRRLKKGQIPYQDFIDLHGLTKAAAENAVREFLIQSHRHGLRCVLIIHGRGLNSPDSLPVLKERLPVWLNRGSAKKIVLAFATSMPYDGGTGAIYVLLRRH